jgi:hypothetical protein
MSQYLSHLAALTLNRVEPVQPRLASRFEMPVERGFSADNDLDTAQELGVVPPVRSQSSPVTATEISAAQKVVTPPTETQKEPSKQEPFKLVERTEFVIKKSDSPSGEQKSSLGQNFSPVDTEHTNRVAPFVSEPVTQISYVIPKDSPSTANTNTIVERVQEHFTETTHNEFVIREVAPPLDARQKIGSFGEPPRSVPVKPTSIVVQSEQFTAGSNTPSYENVQSVLSTVDATSIPTIQVTIGRIEIRATQATDKPTARPRAASTTMSLDDYLKQRNGGKT